MIKSRIVPISTALLALSALADARAATMAAGWDLSQYLSAGILSTDGVNFATTLDANYSNFNPSYGLGPDCAEFGTLYYNGQFGSSSIVPDGTGSEPAVPSAGSLISNLDAPGAIPFDSLETLLAEGQQFANMLGMTIQINSPVRLVFLADLTTVPQTGDHWSVSFGGQTLASTSNVSVDFSTNGVDYTNYGSVTLTTTDTRFSVRLGDEASETGFVRFNFAPETGNEFPIIDNVAIFVPEAQAAAGSAVAILALFALSRARRGVPGCRA